MSKLPFVQLEETLNFSGEILSHHWNEKAMELIVLVKQQNTIILTKLFEDNKQESQVLEWPDVDDSAFACKVLLSDQGDHILLFLYQKILVYSWTNQALKASLQATELGKELEFEKADFLPDKTIWVSAKEENNIYLVHWNWEKGQFDWSSLRVDIPVTYFEGGTTLDCHELVIHPTKSLFFGLADVDHGGYNNKVFYTWPPEARSLSYLHPQALAQDTGTSIAHTFNTAGDKIAGVKVNIGSEYSEVSYEIKVYALADLSKVIHQYTITGQENGLLSLHFLANDNFILIEGTERFKLVDLAAQKVVFQSTHRDHDVQFSPQKLKFFTRKANQLFCYKLAAPLFTVQTMLAQQEVKKILNSTAKPSKLSIVKEINLSAGLGLIPTLSVYFEFYDASFDIRSKKQIRGDQLPDEVEKAVSDWFDANQQSQLSIWEKQISQKEKYTVETTLGKIEFYPQTEKERSRSAPMIKMVYESEVVNIYFLQQLYLTQFPEEVATAAKEWLRNNYDLITEPWKKEHYYAQFKLFDFTDQKTKLVDVNTSKTKTPKSKSKGLFGRWLDFFKD
ncbi:MAG: hypothetical protein AB8G15_11260 [Saprospiraceae bacterium]